MNVHIQESPFGRKDGVAWSRGEWPARWVGVPTAGPLPCVTLYRLQFSVERAEVVRIHVTADERYSLYLDGQLVGRGSERGSVWNWPFESYDLAISAGSHTLLARVWQLGDKRPVAQMSIHGGFLLAAEGAWLDRLSTGVAAWQVNVLEAYSFTGGPINWGTGYDEVVDGGKLPTAWRGGAGEGWQPVKVHAPGVTGAMSGDGIGMHHRLAPAVLPPQRSASVKAGRILHVEDVACDYTRDVPVRGSQHLVEEAARWQAWWDGGSMVVPAHTRRRVVVDLDNYYCLYPSLAVSGGRGAMIRLHGAESLYEAKPEADMQDDHVWSRPKGHRDAIEGKFFVGHGPTWMASGEAGQRFDTLWWLPGRYLELLVSTQDEPLTLAAPELLETRYPLEMESRCETSDVRLQAMLPVLVRGIQMCAHETYMDCPYWEQLMYVGDTRLQVLCTYAMAQDDRLPRRALQLFDDSRLPSGLTQSRFPSSNGQVIPTFSLFWISMVRDLAYWRDDAGLVRRLLPGIRSVLHAFLQYKRADGLVDPAPGWNFVDWVPGWVSGEPPGTIGGISSVLQWQLAYTLRQAAELEALAGEQVFSTLWRAEAESLARALTAACWDESRGLMADTPERSSASEHAQCFALLSGLLPADKAQRMAEALARGTVDSVATIYFSHYVLEALAAQGQADAFFQRLELWKALPEGGFKTPYEAPGNTRSDCHAWGSHPLYHLFASVCGIQPASPGFQTVAIRPMPGPLTSLNVQLVHPQGLIGFLFERDGGSVRMVVVLPEGVTGTLYWEGLSHPLHAGETVIRPG